MTFKENQNFNKEITKNKEERSIEDMEGRLMDICARHGNPIKFRRHGNETPSEIPPLRDFEGDGHNGKYKNTLKFIQEGMMKFLCSPIFTDSFGKDHSSRRIWEGIEADYKEVENALFAEGLYNYYNCNALNTHCWSIIHMLKDLSHTPSACYPVSLDPTFR